MSEDNASFKIQNPVNEEKLRENQIFHRDEISRGFKESILKTFELQGKMTDQGDFTNNLISSQNISKIFKQEKETKSPKSLSSRSRSLSESDKFNENILLNQQHQNDKELFFNQTNKNIEEITGNSNQIFMALKEPQKETDFEFRRKTVNITCEITSDI